eukprot:2281347-Ditylum_brightwellii.AAC.1
MECIIMSWVERRDGCILFSSVMEVSRPMQVKTPAGIALKTAVQIGEGILVYYLDFLLSFPPLLIRGFHTSAVNWKQSPPTNLLTLIWNWQSQRIACLCDRRSLKIVNPSS